MCSHLHATIHLVLAILSVPSMSEDRVLQLIWYGLISNYIDTMAMSVFVYDSVISFHMEWRAVWARKITGAAAIYVALRYVTLASVIGSVIIDAMQACEGFWISYLFEVGTLCGTYLAQAAFASIRVFAIDGRQWRNASVVLILGLVPVALNIYSSSQEFVYCTTNLLAIEHSFSASKSNKLFLATRICILMSNLLVVISTWRATRANYTVAALNSKGSLTYMLFRDGTVHFALVLCLNVANITSALSTGSLFEFSGSVELISTLILCRFFLNLRHFSRSSDVDESTVPSLGATFARFATRVIGNLGETIEDDPQAFYDDLDCELERHPDAEDMDSAIDLQDGASSPSDAQAVTVSISKQEAYEGTAADWEAPAAADESFGRRAIDIV